MTETKYIGKRTRSKEGPRHVSGGGHFVDDVSLPGMLHAAVLRSSYAHCKSLGHCHPCTFPQLTQLELPTGPLVHGLACSALRMSSSTAFSSMLYGSPTGAVFQSAASLSWREMILPPTMVSRG